MPRRWRRSFFWRELLWTLKWSRAIVEGGRTICRSLNIGSQWRPAIPACRYRNSGHVFVFRGRRGDMLKVLWWTGDGLCLLAKRLERGRFVWPQADSGSVALTPAQLSMLLEGIDWRRPERTWRPTSAL
ncbi:IS66 family insertion sequence element accessory protein TnpB [Rugamonas sp. CCM 8940]|uniref:IS66 family insertion sequence element accessory protein TnpB n=1 Tax=Rugamonas sp. CCM 8940 TaxID=2765359 RepID=UPI00351C20A1